MSSKDTTEPLVVVGESSRIEEVRQALAVTGTQEALYFQTIAPSQKTVWALPQGAIVLDLNLDDNPERLEGYGQSGVSAVGGCAVKKTVGEMKRHAQPSLLVFGLNALPTFLASSLWELSAADEAGRQIGEQVMSRLGISFRWVADVPGMVRPRILAMIINEAFFSLYENVATEAEIDQAMMLGTAYPQGPFAWCQRIGLHNICEILQALARNDSSGRYEICPLLLERCQQGSVLS
ncbi:MAG: 3-hydroxyacyl-CoA dehydrogenase family protein [Chitinophagales bacterium]|nr:3-hydroxyacyl-CoA dehydrogenase family protein [Chitinophagales bacterium]MDW8428126.1 3-hydroxyacyl-CoA dehydrogenase family protein [Chitinophagales bacterium]